MIIPAKLIEKLKKYGQEHLLNGFDSLDDDGQRLLLSDIESVDFELMAKLYENVGKPTENNKRVKLTPVKAEVVSKLNPEVREKYEKAGIETLAAGMAAAVTVAGGQGSRLGHDGPKGTYDIGLISHKSLFELQCDGLKKIGESCGRYVPWYIMTSRINHDDTVCFFEKNEYFGYPRDLVTFFSQNMIPAVNLDGKLLKSSPTELLRSPDGNGGLFAALGISGAVDRMKAQGVKWVFICGIDNCLVKMADPLFIGYTVLSGCPASAKSFIKRTPNEKAGILCLKNGKPGVIEYTEVPEEYAKLKNENGEFVYGDANVLNYVFNIEVLAKAGGEGLPYHTACKKITYMNDYGELIVSQKPDAYKFEMFLFDIFDLIDDIAVLRIEREQEFAPVKNKEGEDSPALAVSFT